MLVYGWRSSSKYVSKMKESLCANVSVWLSVTVWVVAVVCRLLSAVVTGRVVGLSTVPRQHQLASHRSQTQRKGSRPTCGKWEHTGWMSENPHTFVERVTHVHMYRYSSNSSCPGEINCNSLWTQMWENYLSHISIVYCTDETKLSVLRFTIYRLRFFSGNNNYINSVCWPK